MGDDADLEAMDGSVGVRKEVGAIAGCSIVVLVELRLILAAVWCPEYKVGWCGNCTLNV